jgi:isocitrate/isopropylmalate dehydrogenase
MMLDFLGETEAAKLIESAVHTNLQSKTIRTPDLGGKSTTIEVGNDVARLIKEND